MIAGWVVRVAVALIVGCVTVSAQVPQPFPKPTQPTPSTPPPSAPRPPQPVGVPGSKPPVASEVPTEATLGVPIYPGAQFITSYDAGRGQRFYLFGVSATFLDMVAYYRTALKQRGNELFESPPTHQFETGRFREETMAFPPSVTIKDFRWGGSPGYPNPKRASQPQHFATIIQIVPAPAGTQ